MIYKMILEIRLKNTFEDLVDVEGGDAFLLETFQKWAAGDCPEYPKELGDFRETARLIAIAEDGTRSCLTANGWAPLE